MLNIRLLDQLAKPHALQERVRPVAALSPADFSSHSTVTAVIDIPIAIPENEDRIGSGRSMQPIEPV
jgi:hypothetical protein